MRENNQIKEKEDTLKKIMVLLILFIFSTMPINASDWDFSDDFDDDDDENHYDYESKIKVEIGRSRTKIEINVGGEELEFSIYSVYKDDVIERIISKTGLSESFILSNLKVEGVFRERGSEIVESESSKIETQVEVPVETATDTKNSSNLISALDDDNYEDDEEDTSSDNGGSSEPETSTDTVIEEVITDNNEGGQNESNDNNNQVNEGSTTTSGGNTNNQVDDNTQPDPVIINGNETNISINDSVQVVDEIVNVTSNTPQAIPTINFEELVIHNSKNDCWSVVLNKVYDLTPITKWHADVIVCGGDSTDVYIAKHKTIDSISQFYLKDYENLLSSQNSTIVQYVSNPVNSELLAEIEELEDLINELEEEGDSENEIKIKFLEAQLKLFERKIAMLENELNFKQVTKPVYQDSDNDGIIDENDMFPGEDDLALRDSDGDGIGDLYDEYPGEDDSNFLDTDNDGINDSDDSDNSRDTDKDNDGIDDSIDEFDNRSIIIKLLSLIGIIS